jgi:hypothetical protein
VKTEGSDELLEWPSQPMFFSDDIHIAFGGWTSRAIEDEEQADSIFEILGQPVENGAKLGVLS